MQASFTVASVPGGGSKNQNQTGFPNFAYITRIKVTPQTAGDTYQIQLFQKDAFATADLAYASDSIADAVYNDPVENDDGVVTAREEDNLPVCVYEDEDASGELHIKIINDDASARSFDVVIDYVIAPRWSAVPTASRLVSTDASGLLASVGNLASWVAGTANQVTVADDGDGTITLAAPQNIHTAASPTFDNLDLNAAANPRLRISEGGSSTSYTELSDLTSATASFDKVAATGDSRLRLESRPSDGTSLAIIEFFRATNTTGIKSFRLYAGDGTSSTRHYLGSDSVTFNDQGEDIDFKVKGAGAANALFVQGSDGSIGMGIGAPAASAILDVTSTSKGFLPPRLTTTERDNITSPATGLVIYNTTTNTLQFYNGTTWGDV